MSDDYEGRMSARSPEEHPVHEKIRGIYQTLNNIKNSHDALVAMGPGEPSPEQQQQMQAMQAQQMQAMQRQQQMQVFQGIQTAIQTAKNMDPLERFRIAKELSQQQHMNALSGMPPQGDSYMMNDRALAAKSYPNVFGQHGAGAQQILLSSGMLHPNVAVGPSDHYNNSKNYLE